jgi:hypothetical protein
VDTKRKERGVWGCGVTSRFVLSTVSQQFPLAVVVVLSSDIKEMWDVMRETHHNRMNHNKLTESLSFE